MEKHRFSAACKVGMLRLRWSSASLHSGSAQHDTVLGGTEDEPHYLLNHSRNRALSKTHSNRRQRFRDDEQQKSIRLYSLWRGYCSHFFARETASFQRSRRLRDCDCGIRGSKRWLVLECEANEDLFQ